MDIRVATDQDIPAIVGLLKESLGESLLPKSEKYWVWKHVENPFGVSPVLLATEGSQLIGVRAFMRWRWENKERSVEAVRAVDTATHPDFQGRGIFNKLTVSMIDYCMKQQWDVIFNTPNKKSKPGYIKMGWQEAGKFPMNVKIVKPLSMVRKAMFKATAAAEDGSDTSLAYYLDHKGLADLSTMLAAGKKGRD
jgi:N-acetylglutamate synthase-like GNAT family acetyltransferase